MRTQTLCLEKDGHIYLIRYAVGSEDAVVEELMHLADRRDLNFDWMDAATLSFQVVQSAADDVQTTLEADQLTTE